MNARRLAACVAVVSFACTTPPIPPSTTVLPEPSYTPRDPFAGLPATSAAEYTPYRAAGTASIAGQAFLTTRAGDVKRAAGREVVLDPATPYAIAWWNRVGNYAPDFALVPPDSLYRAARRTTTADADGRFRFSGLPPGQYILRTVVEWEIPGAAAREGGVIGRAIELVAGEAEETILSTMDLTP